MRTRKPNRFRPESINMLESRTLLNGTGLLDYGTAVPAQIGDENGHGGQNIDTQPIAEQVISQLDTQLGQFAGDYRGIRSRYFDFLNGTGTFDYSQYQAATTQLTDQLGQNLVNVVNDVPGGADLLNAFLYTRIAGDVNGSLKSSLTSIPAVDSTTLTQPGFAWLSEQSMQSAVGSVQTFTRMYDETLNYVAAGVFSGFFRFFEGGTTPTGNVTPGNPQIDQIEAKINPPFNDFMDQFRDLRTTYLNTLGTGDDVAALTTFRNGTQNLVDQLSTNVVNAIDQTPGGGILARYAAARLNGPFTGSLGATLTSLPGVSVANNINPESFSLATENAVGDALLGIQSYTRLYDQALYDTLDNFFQSGNAGYQYHVDNGYFHDNGDYDYGNNNGLLGGNNGLLGSNNGPVGRNNGSLPNSNIARAVARPRALMGGTVTTARLSPSPGTFGSEFYGQNPTSASGYYSGYYPTSYNGNNGFGGLGSGFNFGFPSGYGYSGSLYNGYYGSPGYNFGSSLGYGTLGYGFGNGFGSYAYGYPGGYGATGIGTVGYGGLFY